MIKLSDYVMSFIQQLGVQHVFFLPGGGSMHLVDSLGQSSMEPVCMLNEQAVGIAAQAYAEYNCGFGVALVTSGPGATNAITGLTAAWLDSIPCIYISGQVKRSDLKGELGVRQKGLQEIDIVSIVSSITKYAITVIEPNEIKYHLEKAVYEAKNGRSGPVWLDIPLDVQASLIQEESLISFIPPNFSDPAIESKLLDNVVMQTIEMMNNSKRPCLLIGNGVRLAGAVDLVDILVTTLGIPVLSMWKSMDFFDHDDPYYFGRPGIVAQRGANFIQQNSDFMLIIGSRIGMHNTAYNEDNFAPNAIKIMVDIDQSELYRLSTISLRVQSDARSFIHKVLELKSSIKENDRKEWFDYCYKMKNSFPLLDEYHQRSLEFPRMYEVIEELSILMDKDDVMLPDSSGHAFGSVVVAFKVKKGQRVPFNLGLGSMGFGLPSSIAVSLAGKQRRVVSINGDGGFQLNLQELETLKRLNLPVKFIVFNNQGYASIKSSQENHFQGRLLGCSVTSGLTLPDLEKISKAYDIAFSRVNTINMLHETLREMLNKEGPTICEILIDPDEELLPKAASRPLPDGSIVSSKLEDLFPFLPQSKLANLMEISKKDLKHKEY